MDGLNNQTPGAIILTTPIEETTSRDGRSIIDLLNNGTPEEIFKGNSRLKRFGDTLYKFFNEQSLPKIQFVEKDGQLIVANKEQQVLLDKSAQKLGNALSNFLNLKNNFEYSFNPTMNFIGNQRVYDLNIIGPDGITINLGRVINGKMSNKTRADIIKSLILEDSKSVRSYMGNPIVKWQVNYSNFGEVSENAKKVVDSDNNDIF